MKGKISALQSGDEILIRIKARSGQSAIVRLTKEEFAMLVTDFGEIDCENGKIKMLEWEDGISIQIKDAGFGASVKLTQKEFAAFVTDDCEIDCEIESGLVKSTTKSTAQFINEQIAKSDEIQQLHDRIGEMETVFLSVMWLIVDVIPSAYAEDVQTIIDDFHGSEGE